MNNKDQHQYKDRYMLRLPDGMRDRIKAAAAENKRSMNQEIVDTLEEKYPAPIDHELKDALDKIYAYFESLSFEERAEYMGKLPDRVTEEMSPPTPQHKENMVKLFATISAHVDEKQRTQMDQNSTKLANETKSD